MEARPFKGVQGTWRKSGDVQRLDMKLTRNKEKAYD